MRPARVVAFGGAAPGTLDQLAAGSRANGTGHVVGCVPDPRRAVAARARLAAAGLIGWAEVRGADLHELGPAPEAAPDPVDLVLFDCRPEASLVALAALERRMRPGTIVLAMDPAPTGPYLDRVRDGDDYLSIALPVGAGLEGVHPTHPGPRHHARQARDRAFCSVPASWRGVILSSTHSEICVAGACRRRVSVPQRPSAHARTSPSRERPAAPVAEALRDSVHGSSVTAPSGLATRWFDAIAQELTGSFEAHAALGTHPRRRPRRTDRRGRHRIRGRNARRAPRRHHERSATARAPRVKAVGTGPRRTARRALRTPAPVTADSRR
jgi:hypothetical protein